MADRIQVLGLALSCAVLISVTFMGHFWGRAERAEEALLQCEVHDG